MFERAQQAPSFAIVLMPRPIKTLSTLSSPAAYEYLHMWMQPADDATGKTHKRKRYLAEGQFFCTFWGLRFARAGWKRIKDEWKFYCRGHDHFNPGCTRVWSLQWNMCSEDFKRLKGPWKSQTSTNLSWWDYREFLFLKLFQSGETPSTQQPEWREEKWF